ncbi:Isoprenylcysteine carboxyl methyltransferase family-domain-containing protein [Phycomyces blakesleeanus]
MESTESRHQTEREKTIRLVRSSPRDESFTSFQQGSVPQRDDKIRLLDGENSPQNIALYGFLLGMVCSGGLLLVILGKLEWNIQHLGIYIAALALFHFLEYIATALFNPDKLSLDSFLIDHSPHYHAAHAASIIEFIIEYLFFPSYKRFGLLSWLGLFLLVLGQGCRTVAMFSARHNFSHHIVDYKSQDHVLVKHGIYSIMRHPSYFGFYWWAVGAQFLLMNPICLGLFVYWLHKFFSERIAYEEHTLNRFFGPEWVIYKTKTPTWMPLIP